MVELLADSVVHVAKAEKLKVEGDLSRFGKKAAKLAAKAAESFGDYGGKALSPWMNRWATSRAGDVVSVVAALGDGGRLVVLVDDVDRVDPKVLPRLFFALHEVFALPGLSFILALDPEVVGAALADYHAGFRSGTQFLAKVIQFPCWLPEASNEALRLLAERDRSEFAHFVDPTVLTQEAAFLPTNPRELRTFVRGLWRLAAEVERHNADEIDQHLLVIVEALRQQSPELLRALLGQGPLGFGTSIVPSEASEEYKKNLHDFVCKAEIRDVERAVRLALALHDSSRWWSTEQIRYHAFIGERPCAVTRREFESLIQIGDEADRTQWVQEHANRRGVGQREIARECISWCVRSYGKVLEKAADTPSETDHGAMVQHAIEIFDLLEWIWFQSDDGIQARSAELFHHIVKTWRSWSHFVLIDEDRELRARGARAACANGARGGVTP